jgi:hypothetical protein
MLMLHRVQSEFSEQGMCCQVSEIIRHALVCADA